MTNKVTFPDLPTGVKFANLSVGDIFSLELDSTSVFMKTDKFDTLSGGGMGNSIGLSTGHFYHILSSDIVFPRNSVTLTKI